MTFEEFWLLVQPDIQNPGKWSVHVQKCPMAELRGPQPPTTCQVTREDIKRLRNPTANPDLAKLQNLGERVLQSLLPPAVQFGLRYRINQVDPSQGVRLVVTVLGNVQPLAAPPAAGANVDTLPIDTDEVPVEAVFSPQLSFLATNVRTPISRGVTVEPDRAPVRLAPPMRILIVMSEPMGMPPVNGAQEKQAILEALDPLIDVRAVVVDFCDPPTKARLDTMLQSQRYHVVHFIGHGDFEIVGLDPNPQPHLYFEDGTAARQRQAADSEQIFTTLRNGNVPLVVMTACATAATSPNGTKYPAMAFEALARALVERDAGPLAAVGMQFDLETEAAKVFSRALYEKLLAPGWSIDQAVSAARGALVTRFGAGHRSWVNPTVYWRCVEGRVFDLLDVGGDLTPEQRNEIARIDGLIEVYESTLREVGGQPAEIRAAMGPTIADWRAKIEDLLTSRGMVLGETLRLRGGQAKADGTIECHLTLQLRVAARIGDVRVTLGHDAADFDVVSGAHGQHVSPGVFFLQANAGQPPVVWIQNASQNVQWAPGEYEFAKIVLRLRNPAAKAMFRVPLVNATVSRNGSVAQDFRTLHAVVFAP